MTGKERSRRADKIDRANSRSVFVCLPSSSHRLRTDSDSFPLRAARTVALSGLT